MEIDYRILAIFVFPTMFAIGALILSNFDLKRIRGDRKRILKGMNDDKN